MRVFRGLDITCERRSTRYVGNYIYMTSCYDEFVNIAIASTQQYTAMCVLGKTKERQTYSFVILLLVRTVCCSIFAINGCVSVFFLLEIPYLYIILVAGFLRQKVPFYPPISMLSTPLLPPPWPNRRHAGFHEAQGDDQLSFREGTAQPPFPRGACAEALPKRRGALHFLQALRSDLSCPGARCGKPSAFPGCRGWGRHMIGVVILPFWLP